MVLDSLAKSLREALKKINRSSLVDDRLVGEIVKEMQRALLMADVIYEGSPQKVRICWSYIAQLEPDERISLFKYLDTFSSFAETFSSLPYLYDTPLVVWNLACSFARPTTASASRMLPVHSELQPVCCWPKKSDERRPDSSRRHRDVAE